MAFDMTTPGDSKDVGSSASDPFNIDKQPMVAPAESDAVLMICPETQSKEIGMVLTAIKNAGFRSYKIIRANGNLQISQILAKKPTMSSEDAASIAYSSEWDDGHKDLIVKVLGISEDALPSIFYSWDDFIVKHARYSEFLTVATHWFFEDPFLHSEILRSVKGYLDAYFTAPPFPMAYFETTDFQALLSADISSFEDPFIKSLRYSLEHKLKEIAGLLVKAESRAHIFLYAGNLDPGLAAAVDKIQRIPEYQKYLVFHKIERQKRKQTITFEIPKQSSEEISLERVHTPTITGAARYSLFDLPSAEPSYRSIRLVLTNAIQNARDPATALQLLLDLQLLIVNFQKDIMSTSPQMHQMPRKLTELETDRGIYYEPFVKK